MLCTTRLKSQSAQWLIRLRRTLPTELLGIDLIFQNNKKLRSGQEKIELLYTLIMNFCASCGLFVDPRPHSKIKLIQLLLAGPGRCTGQQAGGFLGFGKGDDIADG